MPLRRFARLMQRDKELAIRTVLGGSRPPHFPTPDRERTARRFGVRGGDCSRLLDTPSASLDFCRPGQPNLFLETGEALCAGFRRGKLLI